MKRHVLLAAALFALVAAPAMAQQVGGGLPTSVPTGPKNTAGSVPTSPATDASPWPTLPGTSGASGSIVSQTVGTTSAALTGAGTVATSRKVLFVKNQSSTATVSVCPASVATPAASTAGCVDLGPTQFWSACSSTFCPLDAFNVIASAASTPITVEAN